MRVGLNGLTVVKGLAKDIKAECLFALPLLFLLYGLNPIGQLQHG